MGEKKKKRTVYIQEPLKKQKGGKEKESDIVQSLHMCASQL